jgi:hypothetical protein
MGKKRKNEERSFYIHGQVVYLDEHMAPSNQEIHCGLGLGVLGTHDKEKECIHFVGELHPSISIHRIRYEPSLFIQFNYGMDIHFHEGSVYPSGLFNSYIKPDMQFNEKMVVESITNSFLRSKEYKTIPVEYNWKKINAHQWVLDTIEFTISKAQWNVMMDHIESQWEILLSKKKKLFIE